MSWQPAPRRQEEASTRDTAMAASLLQTSSCLHRRISNPSPLLSRIPYNHRVLSSPTYRHFPSFKPIVSSSSKGDYVPDGNLGNPSETASSTAETDTLIKDAENREQTNNTKADVASRKGFKFRILDLWSRPEEDEELEENLVFNGGEFEIRWRDILDPTPENILALLLTSLLGLAILQIFWQLFLVGITITLAGLKYSVIAVILLAFLIIFL